MTDLAIKVVFLILGGGAAYLLINELTGLLIRRKTDQQYEEILDLTNSINRKKAIADEKEKSADELVKDYKDAIKKYDPDFHDDSNGSNGSIH